MLGNKEEFFQFNSTICIHSGPTVIDNGEVPMVNVYDIPCKIYDIIYDIINNL